MIIYEAYLNNDVVQFNLESEALDYSSNNPGWSVRQITSEPEQYNLEPSALDWYNLEQTFYSSPSVFGKALYSSGNGFALLAKVFSDGKSTGASEQALLQALQMTISTMPNPYTAEEISWINEQILNNNFSIQI